MKSVKRRYFLGKGLGAGESIVMVCFSKSIAVLDGMGKERKREREQVNKMRARLSSSLPLTRRCIQLSRW